jgi:hypothetical protein
VGERTEGDSPSASSQTDQADSPAQAEAGGEVAEALARVQEAVIDMKEGGLAESLEAAIEAIDSALEDALEEVEKGKVANLLPALEQAQSIVESSPSSES